MTREPIGYPGRARLLAAAVFTAARRLLGAGPSATRFRRLGQVGLRIGPGQKAAALQATFRTALQTAFRTALRTAFTQRAAGLALGTVLRGLAILGRPGR